MALGGALGLGLGARDAAAFCVAGVAQTHIYCRFARQAWHKLTSTVSFCVASVVQMALGGALGLGLGARDAAAFCVQSVTTYSQTTYSTYIHAYIHTYINPSIHTYIHTLLFFHTPSCFVTHPLSHSTLSHTTVLTSRSFTTSFVFPSFPDPATTFETYYWKKLTCGVIRSFNFWLFLLLLVLLLL